MLPANALLTALPTAAALALVMQFHGGLDSLTLWLIWSGLWLTVAACGPAVWGAKPSLNTAWFWLGVAAYLAGITAAVRTSPIPATALEQAYCMALLPAAFVAGRCLLASGISWLTLWTLVRWVVAFSAVLAIGERLLTGMRSYALLSDPNLLAGIFNVFIVTALAELAVAWREGRAADGRRALAWVLLFTVAQGVTGSLSGLLCLVTVLVPLVAMLARGLSRAALTGLLSLAVAVPLLALAASTGSSQEGAAVKLPGLAQHSSFTVRVELAKSSLAIYRDHGWQGSGLGSFKHHYPKYRSALDTGTTGDLAHNDYVQFLQEGGPLLLGSLLLLAGLVLVTVFSLCRQHWRAPQAASAVRLGLAAALLTLLLQAGMNFVFYVGCTSLLFGLLLAGLAPEPARAEAAVTSTGTRGIVVTCLLAAALLLTATLGARGLFLALTRDDCQQRACIYLRSDANFMKGLLAFLTGTQPTFVPARDYLINNYAQGEQASADPARQAVWRRKALAEIMVLLDQVPMLAYPYVMLGDLLERDSTLAASLPAGLPQAPADLYRLALAHHPQNLANRLKAADALVKANQHEAAWTVLHEEGMAYWNMADWGDGGRMQLLVSAIPLATRLGHCEAAKQMAEALRVFLDIQQQAIEAGVPLPRPAGAPLPPSPADGLRVAAEGEACAPP